MSLDSDEEDLVNETDETVADDWRRRPAPVTDPFLKRHLSVETRRLYVITINTV